MTEHLNLIGKQMRVVERHIWPIRKILLVNKIPDNAAKRFAVPKRKQFITFLFDSFIFGRTQAESACIKDTF